MMTTIMISPAIASATTIISVVSAQQGV